MIELVEVSKSFKNNNRVLLILDACRLHISGKRSIGILGPNGSGKSTLIRIMLKLAKPDAGTVLFNGKDIWSLDKKENMLYRKSIQVITQRPESAFDPRLKILASIKEALHIHSLDYAQGDLHELLEALQINTSLLERYPHQVSGGEIQRMSIFRALLLKPKLLILDEATSMLDISVQAQVLSILRALREKMPISYIIISHNKKVVEWMSEDLYCLENKKLIKYC